MNSDERGSNVDVDADIANMRTGNTAVNSAINNYTPVDTSSEALMARFQKQQSIEQMENSRELQRLQQIAESSAPSRPVYDQERELPGKEDNFLPKPATPVITESAPASIRERINQMEAKLGINDSMASSRNYNAQTFLDNFGDETFYVSNISNGHVLVTDLDLKIPRGQTLDLLKFCDLDAIKKSRDIRVALANNPHAGPMIKRLTPEEYLNKMDQAYNEKVKIENFKKISQLRQASGQTSDNRYMEPVKAVVYDKLNKLKLSYSDTPHKGISPVEFAQWVQTENLGKADLDQILAQIDDNDLRILVNERKKLLIERN